MSPRSSEATLPAATRDRRAAPSRPSIGSSGGTVGSTRAPRTSLITTFTHQQGGRIGGTALNAAAQGAVAAGIEQARVFVLIRLLARLPSLHLIAEAHEGGVDYQSPPR